MFLFRLTNSILLNNMKYKRLSTLKRYPLTLLSEEENLFKESVTKFTKDIIESKVHEMDINSKMDKQVIRGLFENGLMGMEIPSMYGGVESSFMNVVLSIETLSKVDPTIGLLCDLQNTVINNVINVYGTKEQKEKYLPLLSSSMIGSFCLSEAESGSDAFALKTSAIQSSDKLFYTINGQKMWISNASYADIFLIFANTDFNKKYKGITCFIVNKNELNYKNHIEIGKPESKLGINASATCPIYFNNLKLPKENIIGKIGEGYKIAISTLNEGRIGIGAQMIGLAQGVYDQTLPYLFTRKQFGKEIGHFQAMEHQYAEIALEIEAATLLVYNAARLKDNSLNFVKEAAMAKLYASRIAEKTASKCIEWLGGIGFTKNLLAEKFFRDSKIGAIYEGTSNMQLNTIAKIIKEKYK